MPERAGCTWYARTHVLGYKPWKRRRPEDDGLMVGSLLLMVGAIALFVLIMWSQVVRARCAA